MLKKILEIARLYLFTTFRERSTLIFGFLMPLLFVFVLGSAFSGISEDGGTEVPNFPIAVVDEDAGIAGSHLITHLKTDKSLDVRVVARTEALQLVADNEVLAALVMPASFSQQFSDNNNINAQLHISQDRARDGQLIQQKLTASLAQFAAVQNTAAISEQIAENVGLFAGDTTGSLRAKYNQAANEKAINAWQNPPVALVSQQVTANETQRDVIPSGMGQSAPASIVLWSMFFMLGGTATLVQEREEGTLRRLLVLPLRKGTILWGKLLGVYASGVAQITLLIVASSLLFKVNWGLSPLALVVMVLSFAFAITSLGMLVAALVRTLRQANSLPTLIVLPMSALGGAMWPIEITPSWMQRIGHLFPTAWAMDGFNDIISRGLGLNDILLEAGVLLLFGLAFLAIGVWRFRYE